MALIQNGIKKRVAAIIAEYNPFHNGHKFHIEKTRRSGADFIIAVMSGNTVQRGETAVFDKHMRARCAIENGCDLVIELPFPFCCSSAEDFARGAVSLIGRLGVADMLSFGCETDDTELLIKTADACSELSDSDSVSELMKQGVSYPTAVCIAIEKLYGKEYAECLSSPNNTLAIEYIRAIKQSGFDISLMPIKRLGAGHDSDDVSDGIASASYIRRIIRSGGDTTGLLPYDISKIRSGDIDALSDIILLSLMSNEKALSSMPADMAVRVKEVLSRGDVCTFNGLVDAVKSKNFTRARISRELFSAFILSMTGIDCRGSKPYARVLAFNDNGRLLLREIDVKKKDIVVSTSLSELEAENPKLAAIDNFTSRIQSLTAKNPIANEYTRKFSGYVRG